MKKITILAIILLFEVSVYSSPPYWYVLQKKIADHLTAKKEEIKRKEHRDKEKKFSKQRVLAKRTKIFRGDCGIKGKVVDRNGIPINHYIEVNVIDEYGYRHIRYQNNLYSDSGKFSFDGLYTGKYTVAVEDYNYDNAFTVYLGNDTSSENADWVKLISGLITDVGTIVIDTTLMEHTQEPEDTIKISGNIYLENGKTTPIDCDFYIEFVYVTSHGYIFRGYDSPVFSDSSGFFSTEIKLPKGEYYAIVKDISLGNGKYGVPLWLSGEKLDQIPEKIIVNGGDLTEIELYVIEGAIICGIAQDENDTIIGGVTIRCITDEGYVFDYDYPNSEYPQFKFTGLPAGDYYLKTSFPEEYEDNFYYPGTKNFSQAEKITVEIGESLYVDFSLKSVGSSVTVDKAVIKGIVKDYDGNIIEQGEINVKYKDSISYEWNYWFDSDTFFTEVNAGEEFIFSLASDDYGKPDIYLCNTWYSNALSASDAEMVTLYEGETLSVDITLRQGGSIAGFITDTNGDRINTAKYIVGEGQSALGEYEYEIGNFITAVNQQDSIQKYYGNFGNCFPGAYRIPGVAPGTYNIFSISVLFLWEETPGAADISNGDLAGSGTLSSSDILVSKGETTVADMQSSSGIVSGMIKGTYTLKDPLFFDDFMIVVCCNEDGEIASYMYSESNYQNIAPDKVALYPFYRRDDYTWDSINVSTVSSSPVDITIMLPQLSMGDYYIAVIFASEDGENYYIKWYGEDSYVILNDDELLGLETGLPIINIPDNAEKITLDSDDTVVEGVNFGSSAILSYLQHEIIPVLSRIIINNGMLICNYNIKGPFNIVPASFAVYNLKGEKVIENKLTDEKGCLRLNFAGNGFANGIYIAKLQAGIKNINRKFLFVK